MTKLKGIDVSKHQGKIDWDKVKADGIQFAMIRAGIGSDQKNQDDPYFERNVRECERVGIPWGAYLYSYALSIKQAESEADHMLRLLKGKNPSFPIAYDMEDADNYKTKHGMPSPTALVNYCDTFLRILEGSEYYVSLYASLGWLEGKLKSSKLDRYDKWVAQWNNNKSSDYKGSHQMWQYASDGSVNGIAGNVDMNIAYYHFNWDQKRKPSKTTKYTIKYGDTLGQIAIDHGTTQGAIMKANKAITDPGKIYAGQTIKIPK